jgi:hypothetical protein
MDCCPSRFPIGATVGLERSGHGESAPPDTHEGMPVAVARARAGRWKRRRRIMAPVCTAHADDAASSRGVARVPRRIATRSRPLVGGGEADGLLYYVMPPPVDVWLKPLSARQRRSCAPTPSPPFSPTAS